MINPRFIPVLRELVHDLVEQDYRKLENDGRSGRLTAAELEYAVSHYHRHLLFAKET